MKTADGVKVKPGDKVWVIGSCGPAQAEVEHPVPRTNYMMYGENVKVSNSFSTEEAAKAHVNAARKKGKK